MSLLQFLFSFEGRIRRLHLWAFFLVLTAVYGGLFWQFGHWSVAHHDMHPFSYTVSVVSHTPLLWALGPLFLWAKLAVLTKRWHDRDKSGWWILISFVPVIGWLWQFIECALLDGTPGTNRFGPSPKSAETFSKTAHNLP